MSLAFGMLWEITDWMTAILQLDVITTCTVVCILLNDMLNYLSHLTYSHLEQTSHLIWHLTALDICWHWRCHVP